MLDQEPIRALHIFSDKKFLPWVKKTFSSMNWNSSYIVLNPKNRKGVVVIDDQTVEVSIDAIGQKKVLEQINASEIVFHYFLDNIKGNLIYRSNENIIHCWCFYGAEIYQQTSLFRNELYGPVTNQLLKSLPEIKFRYNLRKFYYKYILLQKPPVESLLHAIPRIYRILWYVEEEIKKINTRLTLPTWQFFQFFGFADIIPAETPYTTRTNKHILIGNSATIENNHADALDVLRKLDLDNYKVSLPMTYGLFPRYKRKIKERFKKNLGEKVFFLEGHLELKAYYDFLLQHPTAIFLHYRQQGLGNILYMAYTGTKVYLSGRNVIFQWLIQNQIKVFNFEEQFEEDFLHQNLVLDDITIAENRKGIETLLNHQKNQNTLRGLEDEVLHKRQMLSK